MNFKWFLAVGAFVGLFALSAATTAAPASDKNYILSELEKLLSGHPPNIHDVEDGTGFIGDVLGLWKLIVMVTTLDDIKFFESTTTIPTGPGKYSQIEFHNTHLRGRHKLSQLGPSTVEEVTAEYVILNFTAASNALEFHSEMVERNNDGSSTGLRSFATLKNVNVHMTVHINVTLGSLLPIRFTDVYMVGTPELSVWAKTLNSQWGDAPAGSNGIAMAKVVEHLKKTHIPLLLGNLFSQKTVAAVNKAIENAYRKSSVNSEVGPTGVFQNAFSLFHTYKTKMCDSYKLDLNHTLEFGQPGTDRITVKNGAIRGLDYLRRTDCAGIESCQNVPCPGSIIFGYDDVYIDYDVQADWNGRSSEGKMTVTISGLEQKDNYECQRWCTPTVPSMCGSTSVKESAEFTKLGKVMVDVEGLPEELHPRHRDLIEFAEMTRANLLQQIAAGSYGQSHFDHERCTIV